MMIQTAVYSEAVSFNGRYPSARLDSCRCRFRCSGNITATASRKPWRVVASLETTTAVPTAGRG
eukprot:scaffold236987_cov33-Prasinocladus_malaysianus.AAC.1